MGKKIVLDAETRARILAGDTEIELADEGAPPAQAAGTTPATPPAAPAAAAPAAPAPVAAAPAAPAAPSADLVANLMSQISTKDTALVEANVKIATLTAASKDAADSLPGLLAIAQGVIGNMQVALGGSNTAAALAAADAVKEHARIAPIYTEKFKAGGISVPQASTEEPGAGAGNVHPLFAQRLAAANAK